MPDRKREQASAYLAEAERTLDSAHVLFEADPERFASQVVKNGYDALEQALSAGIAATGREVPRRHPGELQAFFGEHDDAELERTATHRLSRRDEAQYVDFDGRSLSVPSDHFDRDDAERVLDDAADVLQYVREMVATPG